VTAARDMATVDKACAYGAFDYVVKPFTRATVAAKLADYTTYRRSAMSVLTSADQIVIDRILKILHRSCPPPTKLLRETLESIITVLRTAEEPLRAEEIARQAGVKRETANRYLKHLHEQGIAERLIYHEGPGHPWHLYSLAFPWKLPSSAR
jgi:response regulator of citrate/malate metabolism